MDRIPIGKIVKLAILCLIVGWLLALFGVSPDHIWQDLGHLARRIATTTVLFFEWAWQYMILGAAVVLPIYAAMVAYRKLRGRRN